MVYRCQLGQFWIVKEKTEKAVATHSSTLAWKIPQMEEPGGLQSMGSLRVGQDWATSLSLFTFMHWRRKWQPTPVFLPGKSQGWGEPSGLLSMGSHRVGHDWSDLAATNLVRPHLNLLYLEKPYLRLRSYSPVLNRHKLGVGNTIYPITV